MKARINTFALRQTRLESASLGVLGTVAHAVAEPGDYLGTVLRGDLVVGRFRLAVSKEAGEQQVDLDLARFAQSGQVTPREVSLALRAGGYLLLFVSEGPGGFRVTLDLAPSAKHDRKPRQAFDSARLCPSDVFVATLIRPGDYETAETTGGGRGKVVVTYPAAGEHPFRPEAPTNVTVRSGAMVPDALRIAPAQGVVFRIDMPDAAIVIDLCAPDDGPGVPREGVRSRVRWTPPPRGKAR